MKFFSKKQPVEVKPEEKKRSRLSKATIVFYAWMVVSGFIASNVIYGKSVEAYEYLDNHEMHWIDTRTQAVINSPCPDLTCEPIIDIAKK